MSARVESTPVRESPTRPIVIAIVAALGLGAVAVGTVSIAFDDDRPAAVTSVQAPLWDAQKLEAMQGRVLAEQVATAGAVVPALEPGELKAILEGRAPAQQVGAEDPILVPHIPKRAPRE